MQKTSLQHLFQQLHNNKTIIVNKYVTNLPHVLARVAILRKGVMKERVIVANYIREVQI